MKELLVSLGVSAVAIALVLEVVKSATKAKGKEMATWLQIFIPLVLSVALSWVAWSALELIGKVQIIALYALGVFLVQYYLSMEVMKRIAKAVAKFLLRKKGLNADEIKEIMGE